jgi:hypothetical protein
VEGGLLHSARSDVPALPVKLWAIEDQEDAFDFECVGGGAPTAYDSLLHGQAATQTAIHRFVVVRLFTAGLWVGLPDVFQK